MKKLISLVVLLILSLSIGVNASALEKNYLEVSEGLQEALIENGISISELEYVTTRVSVQEDMPVDESNNVKTVTYETIYRYVDPANSVMRSLASPTYNYINDYKVEVYLYDTNTQEEHARGYVSGNFRYNQEYDEAKCLSTDAGQISAQSGYKVETNHRTNNSTGSLGGAYGEVIFKWGLWDKSVNKINITCTSSGKVTYTHTKS